MSEQTAGQAASGQDASTRIYSRIAGTGSYLPEKVLTNDDLRQFVDTSDEWIRQRTGIQSRHWVTEGTTQTSLALEASRRALAMAKLPACMRPRST